MTSAEGSQEALYVAHRGTAAQCRARHSRRRLLRAAGGATAATDAKDLVAFSKPEAWESFTSLCVSALLLESLAALRPDFGSRTGGEHMLDADNRRAQSPLSRALGDSARAAEEAREESVVLSDWCGLRPT